jgi:hypothetical protein
MALLVPEGESAGVLKLGDAEGVLVRVTSSSS